MANDYTQIKSTVEEIPEEGGEEEGEAPENIGGKPVSTYMHIKKFVGHTCTTVKRKM